MARIRVVDNTVIKTLAGRLQLGAELSAYQRLQKTLTGADLGAGWRVVTPQVSGYSAAELTITLTRLPGSSLDELLRAATQEQTGKGSLSRAQGCPASHNAIPWRRIGAALGCYHRAAALTDGRVASFGDPTAGNFLISREQRSIGLIDPAEHAGRAVSPWADMLVLLWCIGGLQLRGADSRARVAQAGLLYGWRQALDPAQRRLLPLRPPRSAHDHLRGRLQQRWAGRRRSARAAGWAAHGAWRWIWLPAVLREEGRLAG